MGFHMPPYYSVNHLHLHCQYGQFDFPSIAETNDHYILPTPLYRELINSKEAEHVKYIRMKYDPLTYPYKPIHEAISEIRQYGKVKAIGRYQENPFIFHRDQWAEYIGRHLGIGNPERDVYAALIYELEHLEALEGEKPTKEMWYRKFKSKLGFSKEP